MTNLRFKLLSQCYTSHSGVLSLLFAIVFLVLASGCSGDENRLFERLDSGQTGVDFVNSTYADYAGAPFDEVFTASDLEGAYEARAVRFETSYLENRGDGTFEVRALPREVQTAPVFGMRSGDYDGDGHMDLLMVGNWYAPDSETGRADTFVGMHLRGDGTGHFTPESGTETGFFVDGDAKGLAELVNTDGEPLVLATQNGGLLKAFPRA